MDLRYASPSYFLILLILLGKQAYFSEEFKLKYDQQKTSRNALPILTPSSVIKQLKCHIVNPIGPRADKNNLILEFLSFKSKKDLNVMYTKCESYPPIRTKLSGDLGLHINDYLVLQGNIKDGENYIECWITVCGLNKQNSINMSNAIVTPGTSPILRRLTREIEDLDVENEGDPLERSDLAAYNLKSSRFLPFYYPSRTMSGFTDKKGVINPLSLYLVRGKKGLFYVMPPMKTSKEKGIVEGDLNDKRAPPQGFWGSRGK